MRNNKVILDKIMNTPAVEFVNVKEPDGIKLKALMECRKGEEGEPKKDISKVTYREFLIKFSDFCRDRAVGKVLSFVYDWAYFRGTSVIWAELLHLNYNQIVEEISNLIENDNGRKSFLEGVVGCGITQCMRENNENTLDSYYQQAAALIQAATQNHDNEKLYRENMNLAIHITYNNIFGLLVAYARLSRKLEISFEEMVDRKKEVQTFFNEVAENYNWFLIAVMSDEYCNDNTRKYLYVDDMDINITIDYSNMSYSFTKNIGLPFQVKSMEILFQKALDDEWSQFEKYYKEFRDIIISKGY